MSTEPQGVSRRAMLKSGAAVGGLVWSVPLLQAVSMTPAHAATTSAPASVQGIKASAGTDIAAEGRALPRTGTDAAPVAAIGVGAVALGAVAVVAARKLISPDEDGAANDS